MERNEENSSDQTTYLRRLELDYRKVKGSKIEKKAEIFEQFKEYQNIYLERALRSEIIDNKEYMARRAILINFIEQKEEEIKRELKLADDKKIFEPIKRIFAKRDNGISEKLDCTIITIGGNDGQNKNKSENDENSR